MKTLDQNLKFQLEPPIVLDFDINNACRICLVGKNLVSIFDDKYAVNNVTLAELLRECSNYEVKQHDQYPQRICKQCIENARIAYIFRKQCEISHKLINTIGKGSDRDKDLEDNSTQTSQASPKLSNSCGDCDRRLKTIKEKSTDCSKGNRKPHISFSEKTKKPVNYVRHAKTIIKKQPKTYNNNHINLDVSSSIEDVGLKTPVSNSDQEIFDMPEIVENASKIQKMLMKTCQEMIKSNKLYKKQIKNIDNNNEKSYYMYNMDKANSKNKSVTYECSDCLKIFTTPIEFQKHLKLCRKDLLFKLNKIKSDKLLSTGSSVRSIKTISAVGKKKYKKYEYCKVCNKVFTNLNTYRNHIKLHEKTVVFSCLYCNKKYLKSQNLTLHIERYHPDKSTIIKQYKPCDTCKKLYQSKELISKNHIKKVDNRCPSCKMANIKLNATINSNNNNSNPKGITAISRQKVYICNICNEEFNDVSLLKAHQKSHIIKSLYQCQQCPLKFDTRTELISHSKTHSLDKLYMCTKCGKQYSKLKRHTCQPTSTVTQDAIYSCKYCGEGFNRASELITHKALHNDDKKPYICNICGKSFQRSANLVIHMRAHTGEKPYKCILCQKKFNFSNELKAHMLSHTEERYLCEHCNETFVQKVNLLQHQRNIHGINNIRASRP